VNAKCVMRVLYVAQALVMYKHRNSCFLLIAWIFSQLFPNEEWPFGLNMAMFIPMLRTQGTEEQKAQWLQKAVDFEIIGTYAQTELGHGM
jgi:alkylation response protein AidB-like acyl-CoA dehydrogenase